MLQKVQELKQQNSQIIQFLTNKNIVEIADKPVNYKKTYNLDVPITTLSDFLEFDKILKTNSLLKSDVVRTHIHESIYL